MFSPFNLIFVALLEALILGEAISVGKYDLFHHFFYSSKFSYSKRYILIYIYIYNIHIYIYYCSLLGMILIILGLYSFLWGKRKESKKLAHEQEVENEEPWTTINGKLAGLQLTAIDVPTTSLAWKQGCPHSTFYTLLEDWSVRKWTIYQYRLTDIFSR